MIAVRILIPYPSDLAQLNMRVCSLVLVRIFLEGWSIWIVSGLTWHLTILLREVLASEEQHLLMEAADDGDFRLCRGCLLGARLRGGARCRLRLSC